MANIQNMDRFVTEFEQAFLSLSKDLYEAGENTVNFLGAIASLAALYGDDLDEYREPALKLAKEIAPAIAVAAADQTCIVRAAAIIFITYKVVKTAQVVRKIMQKQAADVERKKEYELAYEKCNKSFNKLTASLYKLVKRLDFAHNHFPENTQWAKSKFGDIHSIEFIQAMDIYLPEIKSSLNEFQHSKLYNKVTKLFTPMSDNASVVPEKILTAFSYAHTCLTKAMDIVLSDSSAYNAYEESNFIFEGIQSLKADKGMDLKNRLTQTVMVANSVVNLASHLREIAHEKGPKFIKATQQAVTAVSNLFNDVFVFMTKVNVNEKFQCKPEDLELVHQQVEHMHGTMQRLAPLSPRPASDDATGS
jgi:hypothetical protein